MCWSAVMNLCIPGACKLWMFINPSTIHTSVGPSIYSSSYPSVIYPSIRLLYLSSTHSFIRSFILLPIHQSIHPSDHYFSSKCIFEQHFPWQRRGFKSLVSRRTSWLLGNHSANENAAPRLRKTNASEPDQGRKRLKMKRENKYMTSQPEVDEPRDLCKRRSTMEGWSEEIDFFPTF